MWITPIAEYSSQIKNIPFYFIHFVCEYHLFYSELYKGQVTNFEPTNFDINLKLIMLGTLKVTISLLEELFRRNFKVYMVILILT